MGLFKSKLDKDMEKRMLVRKTTQQITKFIAQLQTQKEKAIAAARQAKAEGSESAYNLAASSLKMAIAQEKRAKDMLLNFEIALQMRDLTAMTSGFLDGMSVMSKQMKELTGDMNFAKVQRQFEEALIGVEQTTDKLDMLLDSRDTSFKSILQGGANDDKIEVDGMILGNRAVATKQVSTVDDDLAELEKAIAAGLNM